MHSLLLAGGDLWIPGAGVQNLDAVKVFVAMPGSDFGKEASYKTPQLVYDNPLIAVCEKVAQRLRLHPTCVELKLEKDKTKGAISTSRCIARP